MAHTNDIGLAIADALDPVDEITLHLWETEEPADSYLGIANIFSVDSSDGYSNLVIDTSKGTFRVTITRIGT